MRRRFFVDRFEGRRAVLSGDAAHHAVRVLRAAPGQIFELSDGRALWLARVESSSRDSVEFALVEPLEAPTPKVTTSLLLSLVKFDRFEWALEKATELGVSEITPLAAARSEKALVAAAPKRAVRWQTILAEAAQQSRRLCSPGLHTPAKPGAAFRECSSHRSGAVLVFFSESGAAPPLRALLEARRSSPRAVLAIGPEGGWTEEERSSALAAGFCEASLGPTILRTETAVAAALACFNYALGSA